MSNTAIRRVMAGRALAAAVVAALVAGGCTGGLRDDGGSGGASPVSGASPGGSGGEEQAQEAARAAGRSPSESLVLDAEWYQDSDANHVPDFIETETGYDPLKDDCALQNCPGAAAGDSVEFVVNDRNALLILDSSGSMAADAGGGRTRMEAAKDALGRYAGISSLFFRTGFAVFGHTGDNTEAGRAASCTDASEILLPLGTMNPAGFTGVLSRFQPAGWTPIEGALREARTTFTGTDGAVNRVILVSDGIETCGGDPVAAAAELRNSGIEVQVDVVGFGVPGDGSRQLRDIAAVGGGEYFDAKTGADLDGYFRTQAEAIAQTWDAYDCELDNSTINLICDQNLCNEARVDRIPQERDKYAPNSPQFRALTELAARITAGIDKRREARSAAGEQAEELRRKHAELKAAYDRAFAASYR